MFRFLPVIALLTCKALEMINITPRPHHHLERRDDFVARRTKSGVTKQPQVISLAKHQISFRVKGRADFAESTITAAAF